MWKECREWCRKERLARFPLPKVSARIPPLFSSVKIRCVTTVKVQVQTDNAPAAIGPYSQAIKANGMVFCSGQIPINPATGEFVAGGVREQTEQVIKNLSSLLEAAGSSLDQVVKTTVFLADMKEFSAM